jgi:hypothetical protein
LEKPGLSQAEAREATTIVIPVIPDDRATMMTDIEKPMGTPLISVLPT